MRFVKQMVSVLTHRLHDVPILVLMPHSRCNCRCVMCDIWTANRELKQLDPAFLRRHLDSILRLGVRQVAFSGGEPLLHENLWNFCELLRRENISISLVTTGLLLERHAEEAARFCDQVIVSLDGTPEIHDRIRRTPGCAEALEKGVRAVERFQPGTSLLGRTVVQKANSGVLSGIVGYAHRIGFDGISFLAADVSSSAFNRPGGWPPDRQDEVRLNEEDLPILARELRKIIEDRREDLDSGFVRESPEKLWSIYRYFAALAGQGTFPEVRCNAPWVSAVVEADGAVRPCFFHPPYGSLHDQSLVELINSERAVDFRRRLDVGSNPICGRCVCTLYRSPVGRSAPSSS